MALLTLIDRCFSKQWPHNSSDYNRGSVRNLSKGARSKPNSFSLDIW